LGICWGAIIMTLASGYDSARGTTAGGVDELVLP
jgi:hypothetical protein